MSNYHRELELLRVAQGRRDDFCHLPRRICRRAPGAARVCEPSQPARIEAFQPAADGMGAEVSCYGDRGDPLALAGEPDDARTLHIACRSRSGVRYARKRRTLLVGEGSDI